MDSIVDLIGREDFLRLYGRQFDCVTKKDDSGNFIFRSDGRERRAFNFGLWGFVWDRKNFTDVVEFISSKSAPKILVFAEIETVDRFTEVLVVECAIESLQKAMGKSMLPHFRAICLDDTCGWALIFDNERDETLAVRFN